MKRLLIGYLVLVSSVALAEFAYDEKTLNFFSKGASSSVDQAEFNEICHLLVRSFCHSAPLIEKHDIREQGLQEVLADLQSQYGMQSQQNFLGLITLVRSILHLTEYELYLLFAGLSIKRTPTALRFIHDVEEMIHMVTSGFKSLENL